ncbi:MAG TPA: DinB family protein [Dehalococcoidia bacterium]|nr:DinB family protein [Dehalococcoidia bacterium]
MTTDSTIQLAATSGTLAYLVTDVPAEVLGRANGEEWSAITILAHLRDAEVIEMRLAVERMLVVDCPELHFIAADSWAAGRNRTRDCKEWVLADFALQRRARVSILGALRPEEWERTAKMGDRDRFTVRQFVEFWARHDAEHVAQLETIIGRRAEQARARFAPDV